MNKKAESIEEKEEEIQIIGADIGRGYVKGYSEYNGVYECMFKAVIGEGKVMDFKEYKDEDRISLTVDNNNYFAGILAEKECNTLIQNSQDEKTTLTVQRLIYALLNKIAISSRVKIMLGVPYTIFSMDTIKEVQKTYKGKTIEIKDNVTGAIKKRTIEDINVFREADAAAMYLIENNTKLKDKPLGIVAVGFKTTELSYFDKGMKFRDNLSETYRTGNSDVLKPIVQKLDQKGIKLKTCEVDTDDEFEKDKEEGYTNLLEAIDQYVTDLWENWRIMNLFMIGGTSLKFDKSSKTLEKYTMLDNPQMITVKGLFLVGQKVFNK
jgi:hypothetical protein